MHCNASEATQKLTQLPSFPHAQGVGPRGCNVCETFSDGIQLGGEPSGLAMVIKSGAKHAVPLSFS